MNDAYPIKDTSKLNYIDSLRGIAILMVILVHTSQSFDKISPSFFSICKYGQMGVQLFFFLSAYTLCLSVDRNGAEKKWFLSFYLKRYFRIAPLYYVGILLYFSISIILRNSTRMLSIFGSGLIGGPYNLPNILSNVFFVHNFYHGALNNIVPGGWSIGAEMAFYLIFPFIFIFYKKMISKNKVFLFLFPLIVFCLLLIAIYLTGTYIFHIELVNNRFDYFNIFNQLPVFLVGISFYNYLLISNSKPNLFFYGCCFVILTTISVSIFYFFFNITLVPFVASISFIYLFLLFKHSSFLKSKLLERIGQLSYSMYIFHFIFAWPVTFAITNFFNNYTHISPLVLLILCFTINVFSTFFIAQLSEFLIEKPGIRLGRIVYSKIQIKKGTTYMNNPIDQMVEH